MVAQPHFLLFCDTHHSDSQPGSAGGYTSSGGRWHFVLEQLDGHERLEAADSERSMNRERLALLSVVRGLEALEQPSQVSLVTTSRYVSRGLRYGLSSWRESDYTWERFGEQRPVRNSDLWRRVDTALQFHGIKCRLIQAGQPSPEPELARPAPSGWEATSREIASRESENLETAPGESLGDFRYLEKTDQRAACSGLSSAERPLGRSERHSRSLSQPWQALEISGNPSYRHSHWWNLAATWIRWWRARLQNRHAIYGT